MQIICTSLQTDNHASTSPLSILQAGCPSCHPTNSVKALKAKTSCCVQSAVNFFGTAAVLEDLINYLFKYQA